jgi:XRE family transcriptional regulator, regulator of sulfur utilization
VPDDQLRKAICSQVSKLLKEVREKRGLSMTELADKAGLSRAMISFIEHELRNPTLDTLLRVTAVLKIELANVIRQATAEANRRR